MSAVSKDLQQVADYFILKSNEAGIPITNKKLQKLVYYAQAWSLVLLEKKLYDDKLEAWIHGPAVRSLYNKYKNFSYFAIQDKPNLPTFDDDVSKVLSNVWEVYGKYPADYLEVLTHSEMPWLTARGSAEAHERTTEIIDTDTMKVFYSGLLDSVKA